MVIKEMTKEECGAFLARTSLGRLGCSLDDQPYVVPIYLRTSQTTFTSSRLLGKRRNGCELILEFVLMQTKSRTSLNGGA